MIKKRGVIEVHNGNANTKELYDSVEALGEGTYNFLLYNDGKNRVLPQLKYLFGVVLRTISDKLPGNPPVEALYRWFEEIYAPIHTVYIAGEKFEYYDLKSEKSIEMDDVIERIIHHATSKWKIKIPTREEVTEASATELYIDAYTEQWKNLIK